MTTVRWVARSPRPLEPADWVAALISERLGLPTRVNGDEAEARVEPSDARRVCVILRDDPAFAFDYLRCLSVVDYLDELEIVWHLFSTSRRQKAVLKARTPIDTPSVDSVVSVWRAADWFEREAHDLFGVTFVGHPNLARLLLPEWFVGYPGRKSYPLAPLPAEDVETDSDS